MIDFYLYAGLFLISCLYAFFLERMHKGYEPDFTWLTVVIGVAYTGIGVALRLKLGSIPFIGLPDLTWWEWWLWFWAFVASGAPIVTWQLWQARRRIRAVIEYVMERQRRGQPRTTPMAKERRGGPQGDGE